MVSKRKFRHAGPLSQTMPQADGAMKRFKGTMKVFFALPHATAWPVRGKPTGWDRGPQR